MTLLETKKLLAIIADTFQSARFSNTAADTWQKILAPYPAELVFRCFDALSRKQSEFPPTAYALAAACDAALAPASDPEALWGAIQGIVREVGNPDHRTRALRLIAAIDPQAAEVVDIIGWFGISTADDYSRQHQFRLFKSLLTDLRAGQSPAGALAEARADGLTAIPDEIDPLDT